jgi:hypothetical protein
MVITLNFELITCFSSGPANLRSTCRKVELPDDMAIGVVIGNHGQFSLLNGLL